MGEKRRMFHELQGNIAQLTARQLQEPLKEIALGTSAFGPLPEWRDWFHYLLGQLIPRSHENENFVSSLLESLVTGFIALYPNGIHNAPYAQFSEDALKTLGQCIMDPRCWNGEEIVVGSFLHRSNDNPAKIWFWWDASGDFSGSMYFCMKYLPVDLVREWFSSVLAIQSPHWRAQVLVWLVGSHELLQGHVQWPSEFAEDAYPKVSWEWSHCLQPELTVADDNSNVPPAPSLVPQSSRELVLEVAREYFTSDVYLSWLESLALAPYLVSELGAIPSTFEALYVEHGDV